MSKLIPFSTTAAERGCDVLNQDTIAIDFGDLPARWLQSA